LQIVSASYLLSSLLVEAGAHASTPTIASAGVRQSVGLDVEAPVADIDPAELAAMAALDDWERAHGLGVDRVALLRLAKRAMLGPDEFARRYIHPAPGRLPRRQSTASRVKIAKSMKRVVAFKPRDHRGRFAR
jgi:hypothetical protein